MAAGTIIAEVLVSGSASDTVLTHPYQPFPTGGHDVGGSGAGPVLNTQPVNEPQYVKSGSIENCFGFNDWYDRIHASTSNLDLGNLMSVQIREIEVWNAHTDTRTLLTLETSAVEGVSITQPATPPLDYKPLQYYTYQVRIDTVGPPVIDTFYRFTFEDSEVIVVDITGRRVVVWPFIPQQDFTESLEWRTDVIRARAQETRQSLRTKPRQTFQYEFWMNDREYSLAKAVAYGWSHRIFGTPVWGEVTRVGAVAQGVTELYFDTRYADYRIDDVVLIWESYDKFEAVEVADIAVDHLTLKLPTNFDFGVAYVAPVRYCRVIDGLNASRDANKRIIVSAAFESADSVDLAGTVGLPTYKGLEVINDPMLKVGDYSEKVIREVNVLDNGISKPVIDPLYSQTTQQSTVSWVTSTRSGLWRLRKLMHTRKGKLRSFWLPTKLKDIEVVDDLVTTSTSLTIRNMSYTLYYGIRYICIKAKNGSEYYNKVVSSLVNDDGTERLNLETAVGANLGVGDIEYVCFLNKMRLDSDRVEMIHADNQVTISLPVVEVAE